MTNCNVLLIYRPLLPIMSVDVGFTKIWISWRHIFWFTSLNQRFQIPIQSRFYNFPFSIDTIYLTFLVTRYLCTFIDAAIHKWIMCVLEFTICKATLSSVTLQTNKQITTRRESANNSENHHTQNIRVTIEVC